MNSSIGLSLLFSLPDVCPPCGVLTHSHLVGGGGDWTKQARNYVLDMVEGPRTVLSERFPEAGPDALDLLSQMLTFDPARRISVRDAMRHPWLARFYQVRKGERMDG